MAAPGVGGRVSGGRGPAYPAPPGASPTRRSGSRAYSRPPRTPLRLAPHQAPAIRLEILGNAPLPPIVAALLDRHSLGALPALLHAAVQDHVDDLLAEDMREVWVPRRFRARNDEEHPGHKLPPRG